MKYLWRYLKLLCCDEYRQKANLHIGSLGGLILVCGTFLFFLCNHIGQKIWQILMVFMLVSLFIVSLVVLVNILAEIVKDYFSARKKWRMDELVSESDEQVKIVDNSEPIDFFQSENVENIVSEASVYFLDVTALEYLAGSFQNGFLLGFFETQGIVEETNAIFVTDQDSLRFIREKEKNPEYKLYPGYSNYIERYFDVVSAMESIVDILNYVKEQNQTEVILLTKDAGIAKTVERYGFSVKKLG